MYWDIYGVEPPDEMEPRYNIAPNQIMPIIVTGEDGKVIGTKARWNFIPFFEQSDTPKFLRTNARSEEVLTKPSYRTAVQRSRCLVPARPGPRGKSRASSIGGAVRVLAESTVGMLAAHRTPPNKKAGYAAFLPGVKVTTSSPFGWVS